MSRISAVDPATADAKAKPLLDAVNNAFGMVPNLFRVAAQSSAALEGLLGLNGALGHGSFNGKLREAISLAVAEANGCDYCLSAHTALGKGAGLFPADIAEARKGRAADHKTAAILHFAYALVETSGHVTDSDVSQLRQAGVTDSEVVETVANVIVNIFTNYLNHVAGTENDFLAVRAGMAHAA